GVLFTPPFTSSALPGITRDAIITLARDMGIEVREQTLSREEVDGVLFTPPFTSSALPGITRDAIITLARDMGIEVREQTLSR
ncbi:aminotransferase class IV, partial [Pantoea agglomerans]|uniref:aminotransferase class IV n=1 Tax=Enterobacter agglomerans TaxID=549 RepID=UPI001F5CF438